jgi:hypothetical protein
MTPDPQYMSEARLASLRAIAEFTPFLSDIEVGGEAEARVSHMHLMNQDYDRAVEHALVVARSSPNAGTQYLGFVLAGLALDKLGNRTAAHTAYANALQVLPGGDTAALLRAVSRPPDESPSDAWSLVETSFAHATRTDDPYRLYHYGDYWLWSTFISGVHGALR